MSKRFIQGFILLLVLTVGAALTGASSLSAYFYDTENYTVGKESYMQKYVDSTTVEQVGNQYVVTVDFKDAYADIITEFLVDGVDVTDISTDTNLGVYQYRVASSSLYSKGSLSYERPTDHVEYEYTIYIAYR